MDNLKDQVEPLSKFTSDLWKDELRKQYVENLSKQFRLQDDILKNLMEEAQKLKKEGKLRSNRSSLTVRYGYEPVVREWLHRTSGVGRWWQESQRLPGQLPTVSLGIQLTVVPAPDVLVSREEAQQQAETDNQRLKRLLTEPSVLEPGHPASLVD